MRPKVSQGQFKSFFYLELLVREKVTNTAEEQLSHLSSKYNMIIEDGLLYMADGVVVFDPNVRRFR